MTRVAEWHVLLGIMFYGFVDASLLNKISNHISDNSFECSYPLLVCMQTNYIYLTNDMENVLCYLNYKFTCSTVNPELFSEVLCLVKIKLLLIKNYNKFYRLHMSTRSQIQELANNSEIENL